MTIHGSFAAWSSADRYKGWFVYVTKPGKNFEEERKAGLFPVKRDGSFKIVMHDVPIGDDYYLSCEHTGSQRFSITSAKVFVDIVDSDSVD